MTTVTNPDSSTDLYAYNSEGDVTSATDGRGNTTTYSYDAMNRETGTTDLLQDRQHTFMIQEGTLRSSRTRRRPARRRGRLHTLMIR